MARAKHGQVSSLLENSKELAETLQTPIIGTIWYCVFNMQKLMDRQSAGSVCYAENLMKNKPKINRWAR